MLNFSQYIDYISQGKNLLQKQPKKTPKFGGRCFCGEKQNRRQYPLIRKKTRGFFLTLLQNIDFIFSMPDLYTFKFYMKIVLFSLGKKRLGIGCNKVL